ncbi:MAG: aspartate dehydrogenase [Lachnospiraceae bacterium]|nr:aspartate dehydrogenase [Lachnospiraceae bacterium]
MWFGKKKKEIKSYDREKQKPMIRCSICNGEQVAGFKDLGSGDFSEVMLIRDPGDLRSFMESYGIEEEIEKFY